MAAKAPRWPITAAPEMTPCHECLRLIWQKVRYHKAGHATCGGWCQWCQKWTACSLSQMYENRLWRRVANVRAKDIGLTVALIEFSVYKKFQSTSDWVPSQPPAVFGSSYQDTIIPGDAWGLAGWEDEEQDAGDGGEA